MVKASDGKNETATAKDTLNAVASGGNINALKKDAKDAVDKVTSLKNERSAINDKINAVRSDLEAKGIPKKAFDMAMNYMNMDPEKREGFDIEYEIVREAISLPLEGTGDLFEGGE